MRPSSSSWFHRRNSSSRIVRSNDDDSNFNFTFSHLSLKNITYGYAPHKPIIENINLLIPKGRFVGLIGPSGSGKSTLVKIIAGLFKPWSGSVNYSYVSANDTGDNIENRNVSNKSEDQEENNNSNSFLHIDRLIPEDGNNSVTIGYVPQIETVDWNFPVTVKEVVGMGVWDKSGFTPFLSRNIVSDIDKALDSLGVNSHEFEKRQIRELSGGEQQRVFLARALIRRPNILLLDEPTTGVDYKTQEKILSILMSLSLAGVTIIMTTHDLSGIARRLEWVVCINQRVIAEGYPAEVLTEANLLKTYGLVGSDNNDNTDIDEAGF
jgi:ABC-type Mn2+/Zn2+ transport system ATPase subunit